MSVLLTVLTIVSHILMSVLLHRPNTTTLDSQPCGPASISDMVIHLLSPVQYGAMGPPVVTLYRVLYSQYTLRYQYRSAQDKEIER